MTTESIKEKMEEVPTPESTNQEQPTILKGASLGLYKAVVEKRQKETRVIKAYTEGEARTILNEKLEGAEYVVVEECERVEDVAHIALSFDGDAITGPKGAFFEDLCVYKVRLSDPNDSESFMILDTDYMYIPHITLENIRMEQFSKVRTCTAVVSILAVEERDDSLRDYCPEAPFTFTTGRELEEEVNRRIFEQKVKDVKTTTRVWS